MRHIFTVLALLLIAAAHAQKEKEKSWKNDIHPDPLIRIYGFYPLAIGDNVLNKAHRETASAGINASFVSIYNFHIGAGYHYTQYRITDPALAGNFLRSSYWGFYPFVSYEVPLSKRISFWPEIGAGYAKIKQTYTGNRFSHQEGGEFRIGLFADYHFTRHLSVYTGADYIYSKMKIDANREIEDFYGSLSQLQFCVGVQVEVWPNGSKEDWKKSPETESATP